MSKTRVVSDWLTHMPVATLGFSGGSPAWRSAAERLNVQVKDYIVRQADGGWVPGWGTYQPPAFIDIVFDPHFSLDNSYVEWSRFKGERYPTVDVGVRGLVRCSRRVQFVIAHELAHCYLFKTRAQHNETLQMRMHDTILGEQHADEVATAIVPGYTREKFMRTLRRKGHHGNG